MCSVVTLGEDIMSASQSLTPAQMSAIENWEKESAKRCFLGTSRDFVADIFVSINTLKETDPVKAQRLELEMFALCGVETPVAD